MDEQRACTLILPDGQRYGPTVLATLCAWARQGRVPLASTVEFLPASGKPLEGGAEAGGAVAVWDVPQLRSILSAPPTDRGAALRRGTGDATDPSPIATLIPYRNPPALVGYYLSILSLIPLVGLPLGVAAIVLGILGHRRRGKDPAAKGTAHAMVAIVLGSIGLLISITAIAFILFLAP